MKSFEYTPKQPSFIMIFIDTHLPTWAHDFVLFFVKFEHCKV